MKTKLVSLVAVAFGLLLAGCQTAPMTAKSRLDQTGPIVVEKTITTTDRKGFTTMTKTLETKSPAAGDLEIKTTELESRSEVGVARAKAKGSGFWSWLWTPSYYGGYGGYYENFTTSSGQGGQNVIYHSGP